MTIYRHAALAALLVVIAAAPAWRHFNLAAAPTWACVVLLSALLLLAYSAWLVTVPCREALWCATWVFAAAAATAVTVFATILFTPAGDALPLGLGERRFAMAWCCVTAALMSIASLASGRLAVSAR